MKKLAIVTTHPIQYYAPFFKLLANRKVIQVKVFYTWGEKSRNTVFDPGFGNYREWDIPLLEGYDFEFLKNTSSRPGSSHFMGIVNPEIIKRIKDYFPDAILIYGWSFQSHLKVLRYFNGKIPLYFRGDSTMLDEPPGFSIRKVLRRLFLKWVYSHIDLAFYVGSNNKMYYLKHGVPEMKLKFAPHAVENCRFKNNSGKYLSEAVKWKQELNISTEKISVLYAGKLEAKKNPDFIVKAAVELPWIHFIIIGNGNLEESIRIECNNLNNVTILPFQNQSKMPVVYRLADIFVLPSKGPGETWGLAINEAMACGRIVIATDKCGGAVDLIEDGVNGFIISPTLEAFIAVLKKINDNKILISGGGVSLKRIERFSYDQFAIALEESLTVENKN